jgi:small subunit ribosomal protein S16
VWRKFGGALAVRLRLVRFGRKKRPFYRIVAVDSRKKRDGAYIEKVGHYDPLTNPPEVVFDEDKVLKWLNNGAIPTDTVTNLLSAKGILLKRNLMRRDLPQEEIDIEMQKWSMMQEEKAARKKEKAAKAPAKEPEAPPAAEATPEEIFVAEEEKAEAAKTVVEEPAEKSEIETQETPVEEAKVEEPVTEVVEEAKKEKPAKKVKKAKAAEEPKEVTAEEAEAETLPKEAEEKTETKDPAEDKPKKKAKRSIDKGEAGGSTEAEPAEKE